MNVHTAVLVLGTGNTVHRAGIVLVLLKIPFLVIQANRPEAIRRYVFNVERLRGMLATHPSRPLSQCILIDLTIFHDQLEVVSRITQQLDIL